MRGMDTQGRQTSRQEGEWRFPAAEEGWGLNGESKDETASTQMSTPLNALRRLSFAMDHGHCPGQGRE